MSWAAFRLSVDFHRHFGIRAGGGGAHDGAHRLGDAALLADDPAHIVGRHVQMEHDGAILGRLILLHRDGVRILHQLHQPADHPINIYHPEGEYLKGLVLYVE